MLNATKAIVQKMEHLLLKENIVMKPYRGEVRQPNPTEEL